MPEGVIDPFEMIYIENQTREIVPMPGCKRDQAVSLFVKRSSSESAREAIGGGVLNEFYAIHRCSGQLFEDRKIPLVEGPRATVDGANRSDDMPLPCYQWNTSIEPDVSLACYSRILSEARILGGVLNDNWRFMVENEPTKGVLPWNFVNGHARTGFIPLAMGID
ncbi:hypothetical protein GGE67_003456 [Rhizobium leucaenae]|nr:hypothetical protein [Rhizobium leucaenae]